MSTPDVDVRGLSIGAIADGVRAGKLRARDVTEAYLDRIGRLDRALGCYRAGRRRRRAPPRRRGRRRARGRARSRARWPACRSASRTSSSRAASRPPAHPRSCAGSCRRSNRRSRSGWPTRARSSLGKLNMDEFAMGSSNENSARGPVRNPWSLAHVPGGSSGGSAAAVAASLCAGAIGTDTGGSIRQPAALCGVAGMKPTYGRVSRYGVIAFASSLDHPGPFGRTVEDVAALLEVIAGADPLDATSIPAPVGRYRDACRAGTRGGLPGLRIGIPDEYFQPGMDPEVEAAVRAAHRRARARRREAGAGLAAAHQVRHRDLLPHLHRRGVVEPGALRRRSLRPPHQMRARSKSCTRARAARASASSPSGASCSAPTCCAPATTTPTTARRCACGARSRTTSPRRSASATPS